MGGGGAERQLSYIASELKRLGHDVHVAYLYGGPNLHRLEMSHVNLHQFQSKGNYDPIIFWKLIRLIRNIRPDIIQTWMFQMDILGGLAARITRTPWILRQPISINAPSTFKKAFRTLLAARANAVVSNSVGGDLYWEKHGFLSARFVIPNALPLEEIAEAQAALLSEWGIAQHQKVILYAGRFVDQKNISNMVKAMQRVTEDEKTVAVLCGNGPLLAEVKRNVEIANTATRIFLPEYVADIWGMMKRADVFVSLSHFEGRPNTVIEAMACGTTLVVSDIPEHREFLDEESAIFVNRHDPIEIGRAIKDCLSQLGAALQRAKVARNIVNGWSIQNIAQQYVEMYERVLNGQKI